MIGTDIENLTVAFEHRIPRVELILTKSVGSGTLCPGTAPVLKGVWM